MALRKVFEEVAWHSRNSRCLSCTWLKPGGEKECFERRSRSPVGFHMVAELPGAATVEAMSRPEQEETEEVFEEARGEASSQGELMAGGQVRLVGGQVPYSQLFAPSGMQAIPFLPVGGQCDEQWLCVWSFDESRNEFDVSWRFSDS